MDGDSKSCGSDERERDFHFAFNDVNFSDRLLRVEILADSADGRLQPVSDRTQIGCSTRKSKRRRVDVVEKHDEAENDDLRVLRVTTLHISSLVLAANSPFFYKLFSNGMIESEQRHATLRISASEEAAVMELLKFMYSGKLNVGAASALLDLLIVADKFEVASCMKHCSSLLREIPMTPKFARLCLDLPSSVLMADAVRPLIDAAKQFLVATYKDIEKCQSEVINLPLSVIEAILSSDDLVVASEDVVYDFMLKWVRTHYQNLDEQQNVLSQLAHHIRLAYLTRRKLKNLWTSNDLDCNFAAETLFNAISSESEGIHERAYKYRPIKVVMLEHPRQRCIIYLHFKREKFVNLFPSNAMYSQAFYFCGQSFFLRAQCWQKGQGHCFDLSLGVTGQSSLTLNVGCECAFRSKDTEEYFSIKHKGNFTFTRGNKYDYRTLHSAQWQDFVREDNPHFINGLIYLRAELVLK